MLKYLSANYVYPVATAPLEKGVLALEADGRIHAVLTAAEAEAQGIKDILFYEGALVPGFVNTHCHLELSHLFEKIPEHTGLQAFVQQVMKHRATAIDVITAAMQAADEQMYQNGIVAVGDISNVNFSRPVKMASKLTYHTFVEVLGFNPAQALTIMERAVALKAEFAPLKASVVPHAPYSVSTALFAEIRKHSEEAGDLISMHNQETIDENLFFEDKKGAFLELYKFLGLDISFFEASGKSSLQTVLPELPSGKVLLVHNTMTNAEDIAFAQAQHHDLYWCLCPNANLYIENKLPPVALMQAAGLKITLGTDSLASNRQLSILSEMKALQLDEVQGPGVAFADLLQWATLNGAEFLGLSETCGSFEAGKKPGVNWLQGLADGRLTAGTTIKRID